MVKLFEKSANRYLGEISEEELQFLIDNLEEESLTDVDYYINTTMLDNLKEKGLSDNLANLIQTAMGVKTEVEIRFERAPSED